MFKTAMDDVDKQSRSVLAKHLKPTLMRVCAAKLGGSTEDYRGLKKEELLEKLYIYVRFHGVGCLKYG